MFAMWMCLCCVRCILRICNSVACVFMFVGSCGWVKVMSLCMYVSSPPPFLCFLSVRIAVYGCSLGVLCVCVSLVSCIVMMSILCLCAVYSISEILLRMPFMFICMIFNCLIGLFCVV